MTPTVYSANFTQDGMRNTYAVEAHLWHATEL